MALKKQIPTPPNEWLYQDRGENSRYFTTVVILGKHEPEWKECTNEEKEAWEEEHNPQPDKLEE